MVRLSLTTVLLLISWFSIAEYALGQVELSDTETTESKPINALAPPAGDGIRVSVLGYHEFSATKEATEMCIPTQKFRAQMQAIKDLGLPVISLSDFLAWRKGEKKLSDRSILITIDDGWKSVYTEAFPILKEFGYPFTVYLYQNYVDGGGRALTTPMIQEMMDHGCSIGCHSVSHPFPSSVKKQQRMGVEIYDDFLRKELGSSKTFLENQFSQPISTYAYPGGFHTEEMYPIAKELGYNHLFTVTPGKVLNTTSMEALPRYIILGTHDSIFEYATTFTANRLGQQIKVTPHKTAHPVSPKPGETIETRLPNITADLSDIASLDSTSIVMRIAGLGRVPHHFDEATQQVHFQLNRPLRVPTCEISLQWRLQEKKQYEMPMRWTFIINRQASYIPSTEPTLPKAPNSFSNN